jgi:peptidoglycan/xylan/chitin deacetylase (PgdA/CDA1 family)
VVAFRGQPPAAEIVLNESRRQPGAEERGAADATAFLERPEALHGTLLADFGEGGAGEAAVRRVLHAVHAPPGLLRASCRLLGETRARRAHAVAERYAYWHGARSRLETESWRRLTRGTAILMYHAFGRPDEPAGRFVVPASLFERQLRWLARRRRPVLRLDELAAGREQDRLTPAGAVVITMDDGYVDNRELAVPLLRRFRFPATIFVVSGRIGGIADWDGAGDLSGRRLLDWDGLRALHESGVAVGAHTRSHPRLPELEERAACDEIEGSRTELTEELGTPATSFSYPYGRVSDDSVAAVARAGFGCACGIERGLNYPGTPLLQLRRVPVDGDASMLGFALGVRFGDPDLLRRAFQDLRSILFGRRR